MYAATVRIAIVRRRSGALTQTASAVGPLSHRRSAAPPGVSARALASPTCPSCWHCWPSSCVQQAWPESLGRAQQRQHRRGRFHKLLVHSAAVSSKARPPGTSASAARHLRRSRPSRQFGTGCVKMSSWPHSSCAAAEGQTCNFSGFARPPRCQGC